MIIYHITSAADWQRAQEEGSYQADSLKSEGFIHCSKRAQVEATADRYYHGMHGLVLLSIDADQVLPEIRFEPSHGEEYPHIYGPLNLGAVVAVTPFEPDADGNFTLPADLS